MVVGALSHVCSSTRDTSTKTVISSRAFLTTLASADKEGFRRRVHPRSCENFAPHLRSSNRSTRRRCRSLKSETKRNPRYGVKCRKQMYEWRAHHGPMNLPAPSARRIISMIGFAHAARPGLDNPSCSERQPPQTPHTEVPPACP